MAAESLASAACLDRLRIRNTTMVRASTGCQATRRETGGDIALISPSCSKCRAQPAFYACRHARKTKEDAGVRHLG